MDAKQDEVFDVVAKDVNLILTIRLWNNVLMGTMEPYLLMDKQDLERLLQLPEERKDMLIGV